MKLHIFGLGVSTVTAGVGPNGWRPYGPLSMYVNVPRDFLDPVANESEQEKDDGVERRSVDDLVDDSVDDYSGDDFVDDYDEDAYNYKDDVLDDYDNENIDYVDDYYGDDDYGDEIENNVTASISFNITSTTTTTTTASPTSKVVTTKPYVEYPDELYAEYNEYDNDEYYYTHDEPTTTQSSTTKTSITNDENEKLSVFDMLLPELGHHKAQKLHRHEDMHDEPKKYKNIPSVFGNKYWRQEKKAFRAGFQEVRHAKKVDEREYQHLVRHATRKAERHNQEIILPQKTATNEKIAKEKVAALPLLARTRRSGNFNMLQKNAQGWKRAARQGQTNGLLLQMQYNNMPYDRKVIMEKSKSFKKNGLTKKAIQKAMNSDKVPTVKEMEKHYYEKVEEDALERQLKAQMAYLNSEEYQKRSPFRPVIPPVTLKLAKVAQPSSPPAPLKKKKTRKMKKGKRPRQ